MVSKYSPARSRLEAYVFSFLLFISLSYYTVLKDYSTTFISRKACAKQYLIFFRGLCKALRKALCKAFFGNHLGIDQDLCGCCAKPVQSCAKPVQSKRAACAQVSTRSTRSNSAAQTSAQCFVQSYFSLLAQSLCKATLRKAKKKNKFSIQYRRDPPTPPKIS